MKLIPKVVTTRFGRSLLQLQKASPRVMFIGGVAAGLTGTFLACRATLKLSDVLSEAENVKEKAELLHVEYELGEGAGAIDGYDDKKYAKDLTVIKVKTALNVVKLYAPAVGLMTLSVGMLTGSHFTLTKRNASLTAAYAGMDQAFTKYRDRVVENLGADADRDFRYGTQDVEEKVKGDDGKMKTVTHKRVSGEGASMYAKFFSEGNPNWQRDPEYNRIFLKAQQSYANDMLIARGHVLLNDVYDALGIPRTSAGAVVGWVLSKGGDNFVDFGVFDHVTNSHVIDFVNGDADGVLLDFNVDGIVYDKI